MKYGMVTKHDTESITEIPRAEVRLLWVTDFYDVPLQGMAEVHSRRYLFDMIDRASMGQDEASHTYWLIALNSEQLREAEGWQDLFCRMVGTHFDFTGRPPFLDEDGSSDDFYDAYRLRPEPDYGENEVVGWFRL